MDSSNCTTFWATDVLFEAHPSSTCDVPLPLVYVCVIGLILLRSTAVAKKWDNYFKRKKAHLKSSILGPVLATCITLSYLIFLILTLTNTINAINGLSFAAYSVCYLFFGAIYSLSLIRMVRLGTKIVTSKENVGILGTTVEQFDFSGWFFLVLSSFTLIVMSVSLLFMAPIFPEQIILFGTIGFATKGGFQIFITCGLIWQLQRCYFVIRDKMVDPARKKFVLWRLRRSQSHYLAFGVGLAIYYFLLASRVIIWYWWAILITGVGESLAAILFEFRKSRNIANHFQPVVDPKILKSYNDIVLSENVVLAEGPVFLGLGIITNKFKVHKFHPTMTRVTEVSENKVSEHKTLQSIRSDHKTVGSMVEMRELQ